MAMNCRALFAALSFPVFLPLFGCAGVSDGALVQRPRMVLPQQPADSIRLFIYRPQFLLGSAGKPVVFINGRQLGVPGSPVNANFFEPGSVSVVDAPAPRARVTWSQSARVPPGAEVIEVQGVAGTQWYLRWALRPTFGYLQAVEASEAEREIGGLLFGGYLNLTHR